MILGRSRFPRQSYCSIKSTSCETGMILSMIISINNKAFYASHAKAAEIQPIMRRS